MAEGHGQATGNIHTIDIGHLELGLAAAKKRHNESSHDTKSRAFIIKRVPKKMRDEDNDQYTPSFVSIGPFHRSDASLTREDDKLKSLGAVFSAMSSEDIHSLLMELMIMEFESRARSFYDHSLVEGMSPTQFMLMLLLDGCYILHKFVKSTRMQEEDHHTMATTLEPPNASVEQDEKRYNKVSTQVTCDILYLVENQVPFFVLEEINKRTCWSRNTMLDVFSSYIRDRVLKPHGYAVVGVEASFFKEPFHILHLLHMHIAGHISRKPAVAGIGTDKERVKCWRRATEYDMAYVKFKKKELIDGSSVACSILDLEFRGQTATLKLPALNIDNDTPKILRNLVALEQQNSVVLRGDASVGGHITAYCVFLSMVACTTEDVALLSRKRIITHLMENDQKCAEYLGKLCNGVVFDLDDPKQNYLLADCRALDRRVKSPLWSPLWRGIAVLNHKYCSDNPWAIIGLVAGAILLVCAMVQAVYTVKAVHGIPPANK